MDKIKLKINHDNGVPEVGFEYRGTFVTNPYESECGRFATPHAYYGVPDDLAFAMVVINKHLAEALELDEELTKMGFELSSTGGGFWAWVKTCGAYTLWVTNPNQDDKLLSSEILTLGYFDDVGEQLDTVDGSWITIEPLIKQFINGQWKLTLPEAAHGS